VDRLVSNTLDQQPELLFTLAQGLFGVATGMPSTYSRTPRMPKVERAPKPRTEICTSCA
jgi:hypothetical protein